MRKCKVIAVTNQKGGVGRLLRPRMLRLVLNAMATKS